MSEDDGNGHGPRPTSHDEIELRRYEARLGVWKVVLGTLIVGLAGILIPGAINLTTVLFDNWRKEAEFNLSQQTAHQQYIKDFFATAVNQDIELRIRFANYFANLSGAEQKDLWLLYLKDLEVQRNETRARINDLEADLVALKKRPEGERDVAEVDRIERELTWAYREIGYFALDRSAVTVVASKKERLYTETAGVVGRLANLSGPIDGTSRDYIRFWELYRPELIGVESVEVAQKMIAIGVVLTQAAREGLSPNDLLKRLSDDLAEMMKREIEAESRPAGESDAAQSSQR